VYKISNPRGEAVVNYEGLSNAVIKGSVKQVVEATQAAIAEGAEPMEIIQKGLTAGITIVGQRFKACEMYVPEVLMSAKAMAAGVDLVKPLLKGGEVLTKGRFMIGTVKGDLHDIGKNLVALMMESSGFEVINLGVDISPERFADAVREHKPQLLGLSALLTTTMLAMQDTIEGLKEAGLRDTVKVMIGGAPLSADFALEIGADGYAPDAASATEVAQKLLSK